MWKLGAAPEISAIPATQELQKEAESLVSPGQCSYISVSCLKKKKKNHLHVITVNSCKAAIVQTVCLNIVFYDNFILPS